MSKGVIPPTQVCNFFSCIKCGASLALYRVFLINPVKPICLDVECPVCKAIMIEIKGASNE